MQNIIPQDNIDTRAPERGALEQIEYRIEAHKAGVAVGLLGIGRCLLEARERGLVAHGDWEAWVQRHTQMSVRTAQRLMAVAREVPEASALARLPMTKLVSLMAVPEGERETFAADVGAERLTSRELDEAIRARDEAVTAQENLAIEKGNALQRVQAVARQSLDLLRERDDALTALNRQREIWMKELETARSNTKPSIEQEKRIATLEAKCEELLAELDAEADARQAAQRALLVGDGMGGGSNGGVGSTDQLTAATLAEAVGALMLAAGALPHMGRYLADIADDEREAYLRQLTILDGWLRAAMAAVSSVRGDFV